MWGYIRQSKLEIFKLSLIFCCSKRLKVLHVNTTIVGKVQVTNFHNPAYYVYKISSKRPAETEKKYFLNIDKCLLIFYVSFFTQVEKHHEVTSNP